MSYIIYELICPNSTEPYPYNVRYVGKSQKPYPYYRLVYHLVDVIRSREMSNMEKDNWIKSLLKEQKFPVMKILHKNLNRTNGIKEESNRIKELAEKKVNIFNITYNTDKDNEIVKEVNKRKGNSSRCKYYLFNLNFTIEQIFHSVNEVSEFLNVTTSQIHYIIKNKRIYRHTFIISKKEKIDISDVNLKSFNISRINLYSIKTHKLIKYYNGIRDVAKEFNVHENYVIAAIKSGFIFQKKYRLSRGIKEPVWKDMHLLYKEGKLILSSNSLAKISRIVGLHAETVKVYCHQNKPLPNGYKVILASN